MSPRQRLQYELADFIERQRLPDGRPLYDAPFGVVPDMKKLPAGGYVRTVFFGQRRVLDAMVYVYSPERILVRAGGPAAYAVEGDYASPDEVKRALAGADQSEVSR